MQKYIRNEIELVWDIVTRILGEYIELAIKVIVTETLNR